MGGSDAARKLGSPPLAKLYDDLLPMARRNRNRSETLNNRFVTRQESTRLQGFTERWRWLIQGHVQGVAAISGQWESGKEPLGFKTQV